ncbi:unnamed protein product [Ceratitis capitata]|uniref:(Mediterranean fruit fly) hypothetical protein n=1 Tax=Ceratitis capitata TaxID=7213 RepID=A0A811U6Y6_CERCA|nr:unnamed protein product [Ceratitis capitata]
MEKRRNVRRSVFNTAQLSHIHLNQALNLSNLSVPRIIDAGQKAKLFCSYEMGNRTLNSVKWYKDGQEFFRLKEKGCATENYMGMALYYNKTAH